MAHKVGTIFAEVDLDYTPYTRAQKRLLESATSTTLNIEKSYKDLGIRSAKEFDLMRAKVHNAYNRITSDAKTSAADIVRAEKAKADQIKRINEEQFGRQTSLMERIKQNWIALAGATYAAIRLTKEAIQAASDLEETQNKFNVVFRDQIGQAEQWSKVLVDGYAMSTREAKQYMASIQDLLKPMGMQSDAAAKMSFEVTKLAADIGSFNNQPTAKVMADIQSALVGNFETMKKYGVVLNETVVKEKALAMGLADTKDQLTANHKAQAAYALIVAGSADAVGDLARSQGTYATNMKEYKASMEDLMAAIGQHLLPVMSKFVALLADAARYWGYVFGTSQTAVLEKRRDLILAEIRELENPQFLQGIPIWDTGDQGARKAQLEAELMDVNKQLNAPRQATGAPPARIQAPSPTGVNTMQAKTAKQIAKEEADTIKAVKLEAEAAEAAYEARKMGRIYTNYQKEQSLEDKALEERLKGYRELAEEEEKIWNAEVKEYKRKTEEMSQTMKDFAENSKWTMSEVFFDAMSGDLKSFGDYWDAFWNRMKNSLARTWADMAVDWGMSGIRSMLMGGGGGSLLGTIGGAVGSVAGDIWEGVTSAGSFIASLFHEGGTAGSGGQQISLAPNELLAILQRGERVLNRNEAALWDRMLGGGSAVAPGLAAGPSALSLGWISPKTANTIAQVFTNLALSQVPFMNLFANAIMPNTSLNNALAAISHSGLWGAVSSPLSFAEQAAIIGAGGYAQAWGGDIGAGGMGGGFGHEAAGGWGSGPGYAFGGLSRGPESGYEARLHGTELVVSQKKGVPAKVSTRPVSVNSPLVYIGGNLIADRRTFDEFVKRIDAALEKSSKRIYS